MLEPVRKSCQTVNTKLASMIHFIGEVASTDILVDPDYLTPERVCCDRGHKIMDECLEAMQVALDLRVKFIKAGGCKTFFSGDNVLDPRTYEQRSAFLMWCTFLSARVSTVCFLTKMVEKPIFPEDAYDRAADLQIVAHRNFAKDD